MAKLRIGQDSEHRLKPTAPTSPKILTVLGRFWRNQRNFVPRGRLDLASEGNISAHIAEQTLGTATSFHDFEEWMSIFTVDLPKVLMRSFDIFLLPYNPPAWEILTYFSGPRTTPAALVAGFQHQQDIIAALYRRIFQNNADLEEMAPICTQALWRLWAYCVISYEGAVRGQCIVEQLKWLKGLTERSAPFWRDALLKDKEWKLDQRNGVFGQSNRIREPEWRASLANLRSTFDSLMSCWSLQVGSKPFGEMQLMYTMGRPRGPESVLSVLLGSKDAEGFPDRMYLVVKDERIGVSLGQAIRMMSNPTCEWQKTE
ncbi:hypothetical protein PG999_005567 [Apiospora kogelbergensis]|uniref:Uncharacterized protein n=1 Tax=Apiospora kogelbergensis TaxID=1337665 RepID=A0AAW0R2F0_9PEZI